LDGRSPNVDGQQHRPPDAGQVAVVARSGVRPLARRPQRPLKRPPWRSPDRRTKPPQAQLKRRPKRLPGAPPSATLRAPARGRRPLPATPCRGHRCRIWTGRSLRPPWGEASLAPPLTVQEPGKQEPSPTRPHRRRPLRANVPRCADDPTTNRRFQDAPGSPALPFRTGASWGGLSTPLTWNPRPSTTEPPQQRTPHQTPRPHPQGGINM
jgi:hypothetical protein